MKELFFCIRYQYKNSSEWLPSHGVEIKRTIFEVTFLASCFFSSRPLKLYINFVIIHKLSDIDPVLAITEGKHVLRHILSPHPCGTLLESEAAYIDQSDECIPVFMILHQFHQLDLYSTLFYYIESLYIRVYMGSKVQGVIVIGSISIYYL